MYRGGTPPGGVPPYVSSKQKLGKHRGGTPPGGVPSLYMLQKSKNQTCFNLDALSVPEALETTIRRLPKFDVLSVTEALVRSIRILVAPAVVLARRWLKS